jgi:hypothetical protein
MIFISWASDFDVCNQRFSEKKTLTPTGVYHFVCDTTPSPISSLKQMEVNVYFTPHTQWRSIIITLDENTQEYEVMDEIGHFNLIIDYKAKQHFSVVNGKQTLLYVSLIELRIHNQDEIFESFMRSEGHKIVAQVKIKRRSDMMNVRTIYVGRAQQIVTDYHSRSRRYLWKSGDASNVGFVGVGLRSPEDFPDLQRIQKFHTISPRLDLRDVQYVFDNDDYSNERRVLPIEFEQGEAIDIQMFNLKFDPPTFIELQVRAAEFNSDKKYYEVIYDRCVKFQFAYYVVKSKIVITSITMELRIYSTTLNNFGDGKSAKTV